MKNSTQHADKSGSSSLAEQNKARNLKIKALVVDDDFTNRLLLQELLKFYGPVHVAVNGKEAVDAVTSALKDKKPYDFACLDILMPEMDGQEALKQIRAAEKKEGIMPGKGIKILMTTSLDDRTIIMTSFKEQCDAYLVKPISNAKLVEQLKKMFLI